ncbi:MAG: hypothetical protein OEZ43_05295 [Gammaproteobacteria bacterium]|nr:hypothetical protein [Gammaproteobacteria bacterium]
MRNVFFIFLFALPLHLPAETKYFVETDPLAFLFSGYSAHAGIEQDRLRFQIGVFGAQFPDFMRDNSNYAVKQNGVGFKFDYSRESNRGLFGGIEYEATIIEYTYGDNVAHQARAADLVGLRVGYKYLVGKHGYITPWMAIKRNLSDISPVELVLNETYNVPKYIFFPTIHIGLQF